MNILQGLDALMLGTPAPVQTSGAGETEGRRCFVGNLAWGVRWQALKDHFVRSIASLSLLPTACDITVSDLLAIPSQKSAGFQGTFFIDDSPPSF